MPTFKWPPPLKGKLQDLTELDKYLKILQSPGQDDPAYAAGVAFLTEAQTQLRSEICADILDAHKIAWEVPGADDARSDAAGAER